MNNLNDFDVREERLLSDHTHDGGMKDKIYHLRSRGMEKLDDLKCLVNEKVSTWKPMAQERMTSMRSGVKDQISSLQSQMKSSPGKWAGIAAGAGLGIGLIGRMLRHRARMRSMDLPDIVIVGAC